MMMRVAYALVVALSACYAPITPTGAPCTPGPNSCPHGQTCTTTAAGDVCLTDGAPDGGSGAGSDGDPNPVVDGGPSCFGTGTVHDLCFAQPPTGTLVLTARTVDTAMVGGDNCMQIIAQVGGPSLCVIAAETISVPSGAVIAATGPNPLVMVAATTFDVSGELHAESRQGASIGPGAQATCGTGLDGTTPGNTSGGGGGGAGGSFGTSGANGGKGNLSTPGGLAASVMSPSLLVGGCPGGKGGNGNGGGGSGAGGAGGGAVYLIAKMSLAIAGTINASGAGGGAGTDGLNDGGGAGGGGAGGMIGLDAPSITVTGSIYANGGGGGGGNGNDVNFHGQPGTDPSAAAAAAAGGSGGQNGGGHGGAGAALNASPVAGNNASNQYCAGGGGGGGVGIIHVFQAPAASLGGTISPPPT